MTVLYILEKGQHTVGSTVLTRRQRKAHVLACVPSAHILYSMLWKKVITHKIYLKYTFFHIKTKPHI